MLREQFARRMTTMAEVLNLNIGASQINGYYPYFRNKDGDVFERAMDKLESSWDKVRFPSIKHILTEMDEISREDSATHRAMMDEAKKKEEVQNPASPRTKALWAYATFELMRLLIINKIWNRDNNYSWCDNMEVASNLPDEFFVKSIYHMRRILDENGVIYRKYSYEKELLSFNQPERRVRSWREGGDDE